MISALLAGLGRWAGGVLPAWTVLLYLVNITVSFGVITVLVALMLRFLPGAGIEWREVWMGAAVTSALFTLGNLLIGQYLGRASPGSVYGAAGSLTILLIWVYYSSLIVLFGAEITRVHAMRSGRRISPKSQARVDPA